jgi:uncharacterized membrane protein YeaQ/YmgE (transglycosylase-associated protein family)
MAPSVHRPPATSQTATENGPDQIGLLAAVSIGIGGMVGAGIFSILGVVAQAAGNAMWLSFAIGGAVALLSTYSYARLGAAFPSAGGAVHFLVRSLGDGVLAGGINLFMWAGYIISLALYATAFGSYGATFVTTDPSPVLRDALAVGSVLALTIVNAFGARAMGRGETFIVAVKVAILILFAVAGLFFVKADNLSPALWPPVQSVLFGAGVLFIGYEGFGLVTNAAAAMRDPRTMLPRALYVSVLVVIVIYLAVAVTVSGNLTNDEIARAADYALAEAAKPFLGEFGFHLIAIAALFSTASAINATLLHDRARRRAANRIDTHTVEKRERRASGHGRPRDRDDPVLRSFGHRHDGQRRLPAGVRRGECRPPARTRGNRRKRRHRLAVVPHLHRDVRDPEHLYLSPAAGRVVGAWDHRGCFVCGRMGLPALHRPQDRGAILAAPPSQNPDLRNPAAWPRAPVSSSGAWAAVGHSRAERVRVAVPTRRA